MKIKILLLLFLCCTSLNAQIRRDAVWCFGDSVQIDFNQTPPAISNCAIRTRGTACSITDSLGHILFYCQTGYTPFDGLTNKLAVVFNQQNQLMENGDSLVGDGWYHEMQIIPNPANTNQYYIFHTGMTVNPELYYSVIDMTYNNGLGKVTQKNVLINNLNGEFITENITAIKHGNGRDYWLLYKSYFNYNDSIHRYLISEDGISSEMIQRIGQVPNSGIIRFYFNSTGTKMVLVSASGLLEYYDFDRCTGLLSNMTVINPETQIPSDFFWSAAFSPNDSVLYVTVDDTLNCLYQFNLYAPSIASTRQLIHSFNFPYYGAGDLRTAINGKIYWGIAYDDGNGFNFPYADTTYNSINMNLSVINQPNQLGTACNFQPYSFYLGGYRTYYGLGINPNYDLGPVAGSTCDSLSNSIADLNQRSTIDIYPNPAHNLVELKWEEQPAIEVEIYSSLGKVITPTKLNWSTEGCTFSVESFSTGVYFVQVKTDNGFLTGKLIVQ